MSENITPQIHQQDASKFLVPHFVELVATTSRLLTKLATVGTFKQGNVGLAEWIALYVLANNEGIGNKVLAKKLGVTVQRANQITTSLQQQDFISASPSSQDARRVELHLTAIGRHNLAEINKKFEPALVQVLSGKEAMLSRTVRNIRLIMKIVNLPELNSDAR